MKIKVVEHKTIEHEIEINLPYYSMTDFCPDRGESILHKKITETHIEEIWYTESDLGKEYRISISEGYKPDKSDFKPENKSSEKEFLHFKNQAMEFLSNF